jgi:flagellar basal-body rod protein FlgC
VEDTRQPKKLFDPGNPNANEEGFVFTSNVNTVEEMASMMEASRSYQTNVEVMNTAKQLMMRTLTLGQ